MGLGTTISYRSKGLFDDSPYGTLSARFMPNQGLSIGKDDGQSSTWLHARLCREKCRPLQEDE